MRCQLFLLGLTLSAGLSSFAQVEKSIERPPINNLTCSTAANPLCTYQVKNIAISRIPKLINDSLLQTYGTGFLAPSDEVMVTQKGSQVVFKILDPSARDQFVEALRFNDTLDNLAFIAPEIKITLKVFAVESSGYDNLEAGLSAFSRAKNPSDAKNVRFDTDSSSLGDGNLKTGLKLNLGNLTSALFGLHLDLTRLSSWSTDSEVFETTVTNGENIPGNSSTKTYNKDVSSISTVENADVGFTLSGRVSLDKTGTRMSIANFSVRHSAETKEPNSIATETFISRPSMVLDLDNPYVIAKRSVQLDANSRGRNFIFAGKKSEKLVSSDLIMVISASRVERSEIPVIQQERERTAPVELVSNPRQTLTQALSALEGSVINAEDGVLSASLFGQVAGFRIKPAALSLELADEMVYVTEKNLISGEVRSTPAKLRDLAFHGHRFATLKYASLQEGCQKRSDGCKIIPISIQISVDESSAPLVSYTMRYFPGQHEVSIRTAATEPKASENSGLLQRLLGGNKR